MDIERIIMPMIDLLKGFLTKTTINPLMDQNIVCYKCNNIGHKAQNCRNVEENNSIINKENPTTIWKKEQTSNKEECKVELIAKNK